jgi:hypothetical protein
MYIHDLVSLIDLGVKWAENACLIFKQSWKLGKYPLVE